MLRRAIAVLTLLLLSSAMVRGDEKKKIEAGSKEEALKLPAAVVKTVRSGSKSEIASAKQKWDGKFVEITAVGWTSHQDQKTGEHAGQTLFSFDLDETETGKRTGNTIPVYFKDERDITFLKDRKIGDKTPFQVRGK